MSQASLDELLQCSVCLERYTNPKSLPCMHTFCLSCLKGILKDAKSVDCPTCRRTHQVPEQGAAGFHDNLMAVNFLSMFQASTECSDCQKPQILAECEHCKHQVCADCRVAHNVLQSEMNTLLQLIQYGLLNTTEHDRDVESARRTLEKTRQVETDINNAFDKVVKASSANLASRKEELLRQVQTFAKFQDAIAEGNRDRLIVIREIREEISACHETGSLRKLKRILAIIEASGHSENEPAFSYDLSGLLGKCRDMGVIAFGDECPAQISNEGQWKFSKNSTSVASPGSEELGAYGGAPLSNSTQSDQIQSQKSTFSTKVEYKRKSAAIWRQVIALPPPGIETFKPTYAVYSTIENAMYCLSEGKVFRYDAETGEGKIACRIFEVRDMALTDSGTLILIDDRHIVKISSESLANVKEDAYNFTLSNLPADTNPIQVCCHGKQIIIIDANKKCFLKFNDDGKFIEDMKPDKLIMNENTRLFVDGKGRIYVTDVAITGRKKGVSVWNHCYNEPQSITMSWNFGIYQLNWVGDKIGEHIPLERMGGGSQTYEYNHHGGHPCLRTPSCSIGGNHTHTRIDLESVSDERALEDARNSVKYPSITSICVDRNGYISLTAPGKNHVYVYDPEGKHRYTIGDTKHADFKDPTGILLMPDGRLVVCDTGNNRIQII